MIAGFQKPPEINEKRTEMRDTPENALGSCKPVCECVFVCVK